MMWIKCLLSLITLHAVFAKNCDKIGVLVYEDMSCTPVYKDSNSCPTSYKCPSLEATDNKCYFKGKSYEVDEHLPETGDPCNDGCTCHTFDNITMPHCVIIACDEAFFSKPECPFTHSFDSCCATGTICPPFENLETCLLDGKKYHEGEKFEPADTCSDCICQKGFKGKVEEPFCRRRVCSIPLEWSMKQAQEYCAPFYGRPYGDDLLCCPSDWICAKGDETATGTARSDSTGELCRFGSKKLKVGEMIEKKNITLSRWGIKLQNVKCECVIPPLLTCKEDKTNQEE